MIRIHSWVAVLAAAALAATGCGDDDIPGLDGASGSGNGGAGESGAGAGGNAAMAGSTAGAGGNTRGPGGASAGAGGASAGRGGAGAADTPDAGDADASVVAADAGDAGVCTAAACECAVDVITAVPYSEQWQTTGDTEADVIDIEDCQLCGNTADHIVTFTAPATDTYRFFASSGGDVVLAVYPGDCTAAPGDVACGEDLDPGNEDYNDRVDVEIVQGATVTVVVGESCEENGGTGTLVIDVAP